MVWHAPRMWVTLVIETGVENGLQWWETLRRTLVLGSEPGWFSGGLEIAPEATLPTQWYFFP